MPPPIPQFCICPQDLACDFVEDDMMSPRVRQKEHEASLQQVINL